MNGEKNLALEPGHSVVIVAPSPYTRYGLGLAQQLSESGVTISGIIVRRMLNWNRIRTEIRRDGLRLAMKVWNNLVRRNRSRANSLNASTGFQRFYRETGCRHDSLKDWAHEYGADYFEVSDFASPRTVKWLSERKPDCSVFCGGGLIRRAFLEASGRGVLNAHAGVLPEYRGMDLPEWAILRNDVENIGYTVHLMDEGVDTGPIIEVQRVELVEGDDCGSLRDRIAYRMSNSMAAAVIRYLAGELAAVSQRADEGRQYFVMCERLLFEVNSRLKRSQR